jgi:1,2-diacylglycerol 3-beta-galactosyltransferase
MKKILILMSDTGGGHRATAEALQSVFEERHGGQLRVDMEDLWLRHTPPPLNQVPKSYRLLVNDFPWLYRLIYRVGEEPLATEPLLRMASSVLSRPISAVIRKSDPDLIVSVHPLMQEIPLRILRRMRRLVPFVTVVTDMIDIHPIWFDSHVTLCCVPSQAAYELGLQAGLREEQLRLFGLPIRPAFARPPRAKAELRQQLGLIPDVPMVLLVSGGEGMGRMAEITQAVTDALAADSRGKNRPAGQMVVICGRNEKLEEELASRPWLVPTLLKGYVDNMWDWMAACDLLITKAGPGTIAEAMALRLPVVLSGYIPGQESANVPYVLKHGAGVYLEDPRMIGQLVGGWFGSERSIMQQVAERAAALGRPQATYEIADEIVKLLT